ncbi:MAG: BTAD domain-containing putative transcriptional regulator [Pyrinomonadaceae bacterium]
MYLLGPFRIIVDGMPVEAQAWARRKPKLLIKLLALQPNYQLHREQLMELLWPEQEPESASNSLHKAIHLARRTLEPKLRSAADSHFLLTQDQQIILRAPVKLWVDVKAFEQAASAAIRGLEVEAYETSLALYGGDLLLEDTYADWTAARREQLRSTRQELLSRLARLYQTQGDYRQSSERFKMLVALDPAHETAHRELMHLYAATGRRTQALRQYKECCAALRKELDTGPERATVELHAQIIAGRIPPLPGTSVRAQAGAATNNSLAILPLANVSGDPNTEYLSDGITESIINTLAQLPQLKVMARSTVFRYKGLEIDPQEVGVRLGVRAVLTGRVLYRGATLNIQTELVDVVDGSQIWGEQYNRRAADILEVQTEIAREITEKLRLCLSREEQGRLTKRYTEHTEAYQLYLKGRYHWNKRTAERLEKGIECFQQALKIDPTYALAYAGISDSYAFLGDVGLTAMSSKEAFAKAREAARQALAIDDLLAEAHNSLAHVCMHDFNWPEAEQAFQRAIKLGPNNPTAHQWYAYYLLFHQQHEAAIREAARGLELDPLSLAANGDMGQILYYARQYDAGIEQFRKTLELEPNYYRQHLWLGWAYEQKRLHEQALAEFQTARTLLGESTETLAALACAYAFYGNLAEARTLLAQLHELGTRIYVSPYNLMLVYLSLDEKDKAFAWLARAYEQRAEWMIYLPVDPRVDSLRAEPRFKTILSKIGFAA